jgi:polyisoprenyl-phosphate glycosyltransferase
MIMNIDISVVVPVLNEKEVLPVFLQELQSYLEKISDNYEVIFVDDGSTDNSFDLIKEFSVNDPRVKGVSFVRNFGHQSALLAGILEASGEYVVTMDADLQHPPSLIPEMYEQIRNGYDLVGTVRLISGASPIKEFFSESFYKIFNRVSDVTLVPNSADYRIITKKVVDDIREYKNQDLFLRGFVASRGYRSHYLEFSARERKHGFSKYSAVKMFSLAMSGITSFSYAPLKSSFVFFGISLLFILIYLLFDSFSLFRTMVLILFSCMFLNLAILGEYVLKIHRSFSKGQKYLIKEKAGFSVEHGMKD